MFENCIHKNDSNNHIDDNDVKNLLQCLLSYYRFINKKNLNIIKGNWYYLVDNRSYIK